MARNRILLRFAAMAVGLLTLATVLTPEATGATIYGRVYLYKSPAPGSVMTAYCREKDWEAPIHQVLTYPYDYSFSGLATGDYQVWAVYEDPGVEVCESQMSGWIELTSPSQTEEQDIYIHEEDCRAPK